MRLIKLILFTFCASVVGLIVAPNIHADDDLNKKAGFLTAQELSNRSFRSLFIDKDKTLANWNASNIHSKHWRIRNGVIDYNGDCENLKGLSRNLWTKNSFGDVRLYVEWRFPSQPTPKQHPIVLWNGNFLRDKSGKRITQLKQDAGDSGILFRGTLKCQANIWCQELGSGEVNGYRTNRKLPVRVRQSCIPFANADNPIGQWNAFMITLTGDQMSVELNGIQVLKTELLPELPTRGPIGLQHHGDPVQFRNIWVKEINNNE